VDLRLSGSVAAAREQVAACPSNVGALDGSWTLLLHDGAELGCQCCSSSRAEAELRRRPLWIALGKREWGERRPRLSHPFSPARVRVADVEVD
jgi:hypothetical protein